jgi:F-type H+-transporting ATPase subunit b
MAAETIETDPDAAATDVAGGELFLGIDSYGWVGLAFLVFMAVLWRLGAFRAIGAMLDDRANKVKADLAEAEALRAEAQAIRDSAAAEAEQARKDAAEMRARAQADAERILASVDAEAEAAIARVTRLAEDRIAAARRAAENELRARAAELATRAAEQILVARKEDLQALTDNAIAGLDRRP